MLGFVLFPQADRVNPLSAELYNLIFYSLDVVGRGREPERQVGTNCEYLFNFGPNVMQTHNVKGVNMSYVSTV